MSADAGTNRLGEVRSDEPPEAVRPPTTALPPRAGDVPRTYRGLPHTQLDQQPDARVRAQLARRFGGFVGVEFVDVEEKASRVRAPGARALFLCPDVEAGPAEAFLVDREFAHLHALPDSSLHMVLPGSLAARAVEAGWAEVHPGAAAGIVPATTVLIYAPRDAGEIDVVLDLLRCSYENARGIRYQP